MGETTCEVRTENNKGGQFLTCTFGPGGPIITDTVSFFHDSPIKTNSNQYVRENPCNEYTAEELAQIGKYKYSADIGPLKTSRHITKLLGHKVLESSNRISNYV